VIAWKLATFAVGTILLYAATTVVFDALHYALHRCINSRHRMLRIVGTPHAVHHEFMDTSLRFHDRLTWPNIWFHRVPEWTVQVGATLCALPFVPVSWVLCTVAVHTVLFVITIVQRGRDANHVGYERVPSPRSWFVGPAYHALHHAYPDCYMSSFVKLFDWVLGTGCQLQGKRIAMTGATGAFGEPMRELLERAGATVTPLRFGRDWTYGHYAGVDAALDDADILVLAHGAKGPTAMQANCDSFVALIERFLARHPGAQIPVEVWAVGSEIEAHPAWGNAELQCYLESKRAYARHAWRYFRDRRLTYRHIVPAAFRSPMGPGLMSGRTAARVALFFIARGFRYVPVTYTGIAFVNYWKFVFSPREQPLRVSA
jgi:monoglucosyldiacylglycerol epimerase